MATYSRYASRFAAGASALAMLAGLPFAASAQDAPAAASTLDEIIVTAQRKSEALQDVPIAVSAFTQESLEAQKIEGGANLQRSVPNVTFTKGFYAGYNFQIRGIGTKQTSVTGDTSTGVHINNAPLTENRLFEAEFFDVERVEVLRGPQGTLYGRNATGGVVNVLTAKPVGEFEANVKAEVGNFESRKLRGMINLPIAGETLALRLAGSYIARGGYADNIATGSDVDDRELFSIRATLGWKPTDNFSAHLMWQHFEEDDKRLNSQKVFCTRDNGPSSVGGTPVTNPIARGLLSQGCGNGSIYSDAAYGTPNSVATLYGVLGLISGFTSGDVYGQRQITDVDKIDSRLNPRYVAEEDIYTLSVTWDITPALQFNSLTSYYKGDYESTQDMNRFQAQQTINNTAFSPGGFINDPQLGRSNRVELYNSLRQPSEQTTQEFRISSAFEGPLNFNLGVNHVDYQKEQAYYIFSNMFTGRANLANGGVPCPVTSTTCIYIDPDPRATPLGHGNYLSYQPYELQSQAVFGEVYWQAMENLKFTLGLRRTKDEKTLENLPIKLLNPGSGLTPGVPTEFKAEFTETTGRLGFDWKPELGFTNETLIYAFYSRGYKGGGPNNVGQTAQLSPTYAPEFVNAYEIGTKNTLLDGTMQLNLTGFYYDYKGYQISKFVNRISTTENIDATVMGFEVEGIWEPIENLRFNFSGGLLETEIQSGNSIDPVNRNQGNPNFTLVKTSGGAACLAPTAALGALLATPAIQAAPTGLFGVCTGAFAGAGVVPNDGIPAQLAGKELPNAPHWTVSIGAQYTWEDVQGWNVTLRGDYYQQGSSYARVFNLEADRLDGWKNGNLSITATNAAGDLSVEAYVKNVFDDRAVTDTFFVDDALGLVQNAFVLDPRIFGVSISKSF
jgi:outer membrane receptor protein involved in Fe transport